MNFDEQMLFIAVLMILVGLFLYYIGYHYSRTFNPFKLRGNPEIPKSKGWISIISKWIGIIFILGGISELIRVLKTRSHHE